LGFRIDWVECGFFSIGYNREGGEREREGKRKGVGSKRLIPKPFRRGELKDVRKVSPSSFLPYVDLTNLNYRFLILLSSWVIAVLVLLTSRTLHKISSSPSNALIPTKLDSFSTMKGYFRTYVNSDVC
jgi:hypothetical protein